MNNKHQPCGKPGCINCWAESKNSNGQADFGINCTILAYEQNKRRAIEQMEGLMRSLEFRQELEQHRNKLWTEAMKSEANAKSGDFVDQASFEAGKNQAVSDLGALILRQMAYFLFTMLLIAVGWAVFHG